MRVEKPKDDRMEYDEGALPKFDAERGRIVDEEEDEYDPD